MRRNWRLFINLLFRLVRMSINEFLCPYTKKARKDDPLGLSLMKKQIPVCMSGSTIFSGDWWNSPIWSPEGWSPYTYMMLIHHQKFKILFTELFTVAVSLTRQLHNCIWGLFGNIQNRTMSKNGKTEKFERRFLKLVFLKMYVSKPESRNWLRPWASHTPRLYWLVLIKFNFRKGSHKYIFYQDYLVK